MHAVFFFLVSSAAMIMHAARELAACRRAYQD
jgi:hypothetical protein